MMEKDYMIESFKEKETGMGGEKENLDLEQAVENKLKERQKERLQEAKDLDLIENVMIRMVTTQMSFTSMMQGLENGDYVIPGFQRMYRWTEEQVEELAISLVRGMPIPPIYGYRNKEQQFVILDGQ